MDSLFFCNFFHLTLLSFFCFLSISAQKTQSLSLSFPLRSLPLSRHHLSLSSPATRDSKISIKAPFKYTQGLVLSLPIGTPPQTQQMVLDTGSQLSWVQCRIQNRSSAFDPSLSSSFSPLPCNTSLCKPPVPDFTLPTDCGPDRACHYSYFYADGTLAEGNLVREKIALSNSQTTPPVILGCARNAQPAEGILGMNLGRLSFASQAKIPKFSYCVPPRRGRREKPVGSFYIGENPYLTGSGIRYLNLLRFDRRGGGTPPYLDVAAYTVGMEGVRVGSTRVNVSRSAFRPDAGGAGQTMVDSGTEYTYLVEPAYAKVKEEVARRVGKRLKSGEGFVYGGGLDTCYVGRPAAVGRLVGDLGLVFEGGVELVVEAGRAWVGAGSGSELACLSIGSSQLLGMESNIIGNYHQQNYWVEFDLLNSRVGFGKADCTAAV